MENNLKTSFIPKIPVGIARAPMKVKEPFNLLYFIGTTLFILSVVVSLGFLIGKNILANMIGKQKAELTTKTSLFDHTLTEELSNLKTRMDSGEMLLKNHVALSSLFNVLQKDTLKTIQLKDFVYGVTADNRTVALKGEARNYAGLALQADSLTKEKNMQNPVFSDITLDDHGNVTFSFKATVLPPMISYEQKLSTVSPGPVNP